MNDDMQQFIVIKHDTGHSKFVRVNMAETKGAKHKLAAQRVTGNSESPNADDLKVVIQLVIQLLLISYLFPVQQPVVLFFFC